MDAVARLPRGSKVTQGEYIEILFGDLGFSLAVRKDWLEREFGKRFTDEMSVRDRSLVIERLKDMKEERYEDEAIAKGYDPKDDYHI